MRTLKKGLFLFTFLYSLIPLSWAAQNYDLKEMTPAVQQAIENRKARYDELQRFKQQGLIGEGNDGFVEALGGLTEVGQLIAAENQDRKIIYTAILEQNRLGPQGYAEVRRVFAEVQRGKAQPGELIQLASGEWVKK